MLVNETLYLREYNLCFTFAGIMHTCNGRDGNVKTRMMVRVTCVTPSSRSRPANNKMQTSKHKREDVADEILYIGDNGREVGTE